MIDWTALSQLIASGLVGLVVSLIVVDQIERRRNR